MKSIFYILLAFFLSGLIAQADKIETDIRFHTDELEKIRMEIDRFEKRISETSSNEKNEIERLNEIDEEISLVRNLIYRLRKEEKIKEKLIAEAELVIANKELGFIENAIKYQKLLDKTEK